MNDEAAPRRVEIKPPLYMRSMVDSSLRGESHQPFAEHPLVKTLKYVHVGVPALKELDDNPNECKWFEAGHHVNVHAYRDMFSECVSDLVQR